MGTDSIARASEPSRARGRSIAKGSSSFPAPKGPVLDWSSFEGPRAIDLPAVDALPHRLWTTSGRAAIFLALRLLDVPPASGVLVPTYHCPTMVAPILKAGARPVFYPIGEDGLPLLDNIDADTARDCRAMIVSHFFGFARSLAAVRGWCDERGIVLIEDCAHTFFGDAGERAVGSWGDMATASVTKFFPVAEGGLLASAGRSLAEAGLARAPLKAQIKGWLDVLDLSAQHGRLAGIGAAVRLLARLRGSVEAAGSADASDPPVMDPARMMRDCDMERVAWRQVRASRVVLAAMPRARVVQQRQRNHAAYARAFDQVPGARPLFAIEPARLARCAPYVFPLWVDDPEPVYRLARARRLPVFRWDRVWPGTPRLPDDAGPGWSRHVLQLLCHQDLAGAEVNDTAHQLLETLASR